MGDVTVERCPETGIASIVKAGSGKVDLMPDEASALQQAAGDPAAVRAAIAECNQAFADALTDDDIQAIAARFA